MLFYCIEGFDRFATDSFRFCIASLIEVATMTKSQSVSTRLKQLVLIKKNTVTNSCNLIPSPQLDVQSANRSGRVAEGFVNPLISRYAKKGEQDDAAIWL